VVSWEQWRDRAVPLETGGLSVATYDLGPRDAPVVTYLHGLPSSSYDFAPVMEHLGDRVRVVTLDFPGFGASDKPRGHPYSLVACADATERLWGELGVTTTVVAAHDYGVSVAQELLARRAERVLDVDVTAVVWMNGGLYPDLHRPTAGQSLLADPEHGPAIAASLTEETFGRGIDETWGSRVPPDVTGIWAAIAEHDGAPVVHELMTYMQERRDHEARWRAGLEDTDVPMTFVWGDLDPISGAHMVERVQERLPQADVRRMTDVGHWPPLEAPADVAAAVLDAAG
jgi:pimeloyl-ACP methyl ester carboxylesterase